MGLNEHAIRLSFLKYVYEAGDDRFEITNAGVRFILIPDWKPVVWREESKKSRLWKSAYKSIFLCL